MHHQQLILVVKSTSLLASCPVCQTSSRQVHSYYTRTIADLCWADRQGRLELHRSLIQETPGFSHREEWMPARMGRWGRPVARRGELVWCVQHTFLSPFCSVLFTRPVREGVFDRNTQTV